MTTSTSEIRAVDNALADVVWRLQILATAESTAAGEAAYIAQDTDAEHDVRTAEAWRETSDETHRAITELVGAQRRLQEVPALVNEEVQAIADEALRAWHAGEFDI